MKMNGYHSKTERLSGMINLENIGTSAIIAVPSQFSEIDL